MQEQSKCVVEIDQDATQTRNPGVMMRMAIVVAILIAVATVVVYANGVVVVGTLN